MFINFRKCIYLCKSSSACFTSFTLIESTIVIDFGFILLSANANKLVA